jgi:two-component system chemotaxis sensor kinase CheA
MSEPDVDDELIRDYLAECRGQLSSTERNLLALGQCGVKIDEALVSRLFRTAHSIGAGAGFYGLMKIRALAYTLERVLDLIRDRWMVPTSEVIGTLLPAFNRLAELIGEYRESNQAEVADLVSTLTSLTLASLPGTEKDSVTAEVQVKVPKTDQRIRVSAFDLWQARKSGKYIYMIEIDLIHDAEWRDKTPWELFQRLIRCGTVMETLIDRNSSRTVEHDSSDSLLLEVLFATHLKPNMMEGLVDVPPERMRIIEQNGAVLPLDEVLRWPAEPADQVPGVKSVNSLKVTLVDSLEALARELGLSRQELQESRPG